MNLKQADTLLALNGETRFTSFFQELRLSTKSLRKQGFIQKNSGRCSGFKITFPPDFNYYEWKQQHEQSIKEKQLKHSKNSPWRRSNSLMYCSPPISNSNYRTNN
jgi:hypothetical protein